MRIKTNLIFQRFLTCLCSIVTYISILGFSSILRKYSVFYNCLPIKKFTWLCNFWISLYVLLQTWWTEPGPFALSSIWKTVKLNLFNLIIDQICQNTFWKCQYFAKIAIVFVKILKIFYNRDLSSRKISRIFVLLNDLHIASPEPGNAAHKYWKFLFLCSLHL